MSRLERWTVYPVLALLSLAALGRFPWADVKVATAGDSGPKVLEAQEFRLLDSEGRTRGSLTSSLDKAWGLALRDKTGKDCVWLGINADGSPILTLADPEGKARVTLQVLREGSAVALLADRSGTDRIGLAISPEGTPNLTLVDKESKPRIQLELESGSPSIRILGKDGEALWHAPPK